MKNIKMNKEELKDILKKNKEEHAAEFKEADKAYSEQVVKDAEQLIEDVHADPDDNKWPHHRFTRAKKPQNHERDYDIAINMLDHEVGDTVTLTKEEYAQYVQEEWEWAWEFADAYRSSTQKFSKFSMSKR